MPRRDETPPASFDVVRAKACGRAFSKADLAAIIEDIVAARYAAPEIEAFLKACAQGMAPSEVLDLTNAMVDAGDRLAWPRRPIVDIHSVGGVPGNRVSMIVVPIVAAYGLTIPKTASRAITTPAGTADTMEVLARVDLSRDEIRDVVAKTSGCLVWSGRANLSPADDILIGGERMLDRDAPGQVVASILSKKLAAGITHLLVELPVGPSTKIRDEAAAHELRKLFAFVAARTGLALETMITDGTGPIGRGVGPVLEARDVMKVLRNEHDAPRDLRDRALAMAGRLLEFDPALSERGIDRARALLESGAALRKMESFIAAQGAATPAPIGNLTHDIINDRASTVQAIDCARLSHLARMAGAPDCKGAGIDILKKIGDRVAPGEAIYRIYAENAADLRKARASAEIDNGFWLLPF